MKYCIAALLALRSVEVGQESPALSLTTHIPLPNVKGRIDHASVDLKGQRFSWPPLPMTRARSSI